MQKFSVRHANVLRFFVCCCFSVFFLFFFQTVCCWQMDTTVEAHGMNFILKMYGNIVTCHTLHPSEQINIHPNNILVGMCVFGRLFSCIHDFHVYTFGVCCVPSKIRFKALLTMNDKKWKKALQSYNGSLAMSPHSLRRFGLENAFLCMCGYNPFSLYCFCTTLAGIL